MPRAATSLASRIVGFFRTTDLPSAELVLDLCKDAVAERKQKSVKAKQRQQKVMPATPPTPVAAAPKRLKAKAKGKRKYTRKLKNQPLPLNGPAEDAYETLGDVVERRN